MPARGLLLVLLSASAPPPPMVPTALMPRVVEVPPALSAATSPPELSGLAWSPELGRYLVVSDDTGKRSAGTNHAPFVLAMSEDGKLDAAVVPIRGLDALNDAEAICRGPPGTFFLVTSHSPNREGRTKAARRMLLHLGLRGRALEILGRADLTRLSGGALLARVGRDEAPIDLEAVAFHAGALFLGFKAPLSSGGEALIAKVSDPVEQLAGGQVRAETVTQWASPRLCPETVCEGVSDLAFLPDGTALVTANSPKGAPKDGGGSLWALGPGGAPRLLRRFPGLKPEGVTVSPRGTIVIVFDRDQAAPMWVELPLGDGIWGEGEGR